MASQPLLQPFRFLDLPPEFRNRIREMQFFAHDSPTGTQWKTKRGFQVQCPVVLSRRMSSNMSLARYIPHQSKNPSRDKADILWTSLL